MKVYVIICRTMHRAKRLWENTLYSLDELVKNFSEWTILNIETRDGVILYFVSEDYWYDCGGRLGRHDWQPIRETYFARMLDKWREIKNANM